MNIRMSRDKFDRPIELRSPQIKILQQLATRPNGMSRVELYKEVRCKMSEMLKNPNLSIPNTWTKCLTERRLVDCKMDQNKKIVFFLTDAGYRAVEVV